MRAKIPYHRAGDCKMAVSCFYIKRKSQSKAQLPPGRICKILLEKADE
ncbi:hypothetical protein AB434_0544 [Heyndrickxia coagulans]|uniref:Uncharacterized protein n=1 Tax=Heyndrickxia coagulans TaxID=1398 RepID=A0AAN0T3Y8_HEYCO|nr:hypothetical protein SB48_HM08orf00966 [Heyndrickxia coagulans]AKN52949.1 hypothetical protein AB434_0544 [Heyndrickxia coagulans]